LGIKERRQRQRQQLREGILSAAREIARAEGWQAVTIRRIAGLIEYSPPVLYEYFDSKEDLLLELVRIGYAAQLRAIEEARDASDDPEEVLLEMTRAYLRFAFDSPDLYQVMYGLGGVSFPVGELTKEGEKIGNTIAEVVEEVLRKNGKPVEDVWDKVTLPWATLHGLLALRMAGRFVVGEEELERLAELATRDSIAAWLKG
jgi:AcrR family transcriptional regulator